MSHHSKKPSLPSIQFLLNDDKDSTKETQSTSVNNISTLPYELQQLSLSGPVQKSDQPSWMSVPPSNTQTKRKIVGASHSRSYSDLTLIKPLPIPIKPKYQTHRRTVSATTDNADFLKMSNFIKESKEKTYTDIKIASPEQKFLCDALNIDKKKNPIDTENVVIKKSEATGRYHCPFCTKSFNRPSSLKIHTYSHTGEKPFICDEKGCGRQFSVSSNLRRHLKIHKLGKFKLK